MPEPADIIAAHPFWAGMSDVLPSDLKATREVFEPGHTIFKARSEATHFYLLQDGHVALETVVPGRGPTTVQTLRGGEALGWSWLYPPYQWHFSARAVAATQALCLDAKALREKARADTRFGYHLVYRVGEMMLQRLQAARLQLMDVYGSPG